MTLAQFSATCGATPKWVQNTARLLGPDVRYEEDVARRLGLAKRLHDAAGLPLRRAWALAGEILADEPGADVLVDLERGVRLVVDVRRYLSDFAIRLAAARGCGGPRRRGRPPDKHGSAVDRAQGYGIDIGQLRRSLAATPAQRLRELDANAEFVRTLRERSGA